MLIYIDYLQRNNLDATRYEMEFWYRVSAEYSMSGNYFYRVSRTCSVLIMPILALAFVFGPLRTGGAGGRLMVGIIIGLAYYLASETLANSGQVFNLSPIFVTWLPSVTLAMVAMFALSRIR